MKETIKVIDAESHLYLEKMKKGARNQGILIGIGLAVVGPKIAKYISKKIIVSVITGALEDPEGHSKRSEYDGFQRYKKDREKRSEVDQNGL